MPTPPATNVEALLAETGWLRGLALALTGQSAAADDLTQDVLVAALEKQPDPCRSLRPWLETVARRIAGRTRRSEGRRQAHDIPAQEPEPPAADTAARFELHRRVAQTVSELPEPYRSSVLLRFYDGLPVRTVAAQLDVPIETARTRIRRGLAMLRDRLDDDHGGREAWAAPLLAQVLRPGTSVAGATAFAWLGGTILMWKKPLLFAAAILALALTAVTYDALSQAPEPDGSVAPDRLIGSHASPDEGISTEAKGNLESPEIRRSEPMAPAARRPSLTGRCVAAETGAPLAGCQVELDVPPDLAPTPNVTGEDGRFAFALHAPTPSAATLRLSAPGRVALTGSITANELTERTDLGDIPIPLGSVVRGRMVDENGVPQTDVHIALWRVSVDESTHRVAPLEVFGVRTDAAGRFEFPPISSGEWDIRCAHRQLVSSSRVSVPGSGQPVMLELVTWVAPPEELILGVILDEDGAPVPEATVRARGQHRQPVDDEGRLRLERPGYGPDDETKLWVTAPGFDPRQVEATWGQGELRVELRRSIDVQLFVFDPENQPIEDFGVACHYLSAPDARTPSRFHEIGHHAHGAFVLTGVPRGVNELIVQPAGDEFARSLPVRFTAEDGLAPLNVRLRAKVAREVVVAGANGPIAGSRVEFVLGEAPKESADAAAALILTDRPLVVTHIWQTAQTGTDGRATLRGPEGATFTVRVTGPSHRPTQVEGFTLVPDAAPLEIGVDTGGTLTIRLGPADVVARFRARNGRLKLLPPTSYFGKGTARPIEADGTCAIEILPDDEADRELLLFFNQPAGGGAHREWHLNLGPLASSDRSNEVTVDLAGYGFGLVRGRVFVDGIPLESGEVYFRGLRTMQLTPMLRQRRELGGSAAVGPDGTFVYELPVGEWAVEHEGLESEWFTIRPGETFDCDFHLSSEADHPDDCECDACNTARLYRRKK
jgi:RNA polymerase sigma-70 factor (ECF subfamily)